MNVPDLMTRKDALAHYTCAMKQDACHGPSLSSYEPCPPSMWLGAGIHQLQLLSRGPCCMPSAALLCDIL